MADQYPGYVSDYAYNRQALEYLSGLFATGAATNSNPTRDAFGRLRIAQPLTLFDSKLIDSDRPLFWDDQEVSGGGTGSTHSSNRASTTISVSDTTAGKRVRQTFQRFNYQPGKSQFIIMTGVIGSGASGITRRWGYFDGNNGLFFQLSGTALGVGVRSFVTGAAVDTVVVQSEWSIDTMDGNGPSGVTLDTSKANIYAIDFEWLGVGSVRFAVVVDGALYYVHQVKNANNIASVYMSTPNLPMRYEIENDGTGAAATMEHICTTVASEGGQSETGITRSASTAGTHLSASVADTLYALIGVQLKTTHIDNVVRLRRLSIIAETNDDFEWNLLLNPTVADTFTYSDEANGAVQIAKGVTANTVSGGTLLDSGFGKSGEASSAIADTLRYLGASIAGTRDTIVLAVRPLSNAATIQGSLTWTETA